MHFDYLVVGAGFAGCVLAERLASQRDKKVLLIDRRSHIGGNASRFAEQIGIRFHHYGPHLFHTNSENVVSYLSQFTEWHPYQHRVRSFVNGVFVPMPINRNTVNQLLGYAFQSDKEVKDFFEGTGRQFMRLRTPKILWFQKSGEGYTDSIAVIH